MLLEVKNISRTFGRTKALDNVSFSIPAGKIFGFTGPNGSGKTTALRIIAGLDYPDSGEILFNGISAIDYPEKVRKYIGYMPDQLPDANDISVGEFINFYASAFGLKGDVRKKRLSEINDLTRLEELNNKLLNQLSKGMKQRVNLARILIHDPQLLLLDEPSAGLDPRTRVELRDILKELANRGKTVFVSSHILSELEDMISGVVIIEKGRLIKCGMLNELASSGDNNDKTETVCIAMIPGADAGDWLPKLRELDGVVTVKAEKNSDITVVLESEKIKDLLEFISSSALPFAGIYRTNYTCNLEKIFISNTSGEIQ